MLFGAGCVHAAMDLFKYAYQLYPFVSSDLLRDCLELAVTARKVDMRASPYDVSHVPDCSGTMTENRCFGLQHVIGGLTFLMILS